MTSLVLDFETRSQIDIKHAGLDNYMGAVEPLCVAWAVDDEPVELVDFTHGTRGLEKLVGLIRDPQVFKIAHNISFERDVLSTLCCESPLEQWADTSVLARYAGLPSKLADICSVLKLGNLGKHEDGTRLINKFCKPRKDGSFRDSTSDPADWQKFLNYCKQDVIAEREVFKRLKAFMLPEREKRLWLLDDKINRRGWPVDKQYVHGASRQAATEKHKLMQELKSLTGLANPNSRDQFLGWARAQGYKYSSLGKDFIARFEKELSDEEIAA